MKISFCDCLSGADPGHRAEAHKNLWNVGDPWVLKLKRAHSGEGCWGFTSLPHAKFPLLLVTPVSLFSADGHEVCEVAFQMLELHGTTGGVLWWEVHNLGGVNLHKPLTWKVQLLLGLLYTLLLPVVLHISYSWPNGQPSWGGRLGCSCHPLNRQNLTSLKGKDTAKWLVWTVLASPLPPFISSPLSFPA